MGRSPCGEKGSGLNRGTWSAQEDQILRDYIKTHGEGKWGKVSNQTGLRRCGKSCRLRWLNYLRPDIKRGNIADNEEDLIIRLHKLVGNRWSLIAGRLPGRTDNEIKNYWNSKLKKKLQASTNRSEHPGKEPSLNIEQPRNKHEQNEPCNILPESSPNNIGALMKNSTKLADSDSSYELLPYALEHQTDTSWNFIMDPGDDQFSNDITEFLNTDFSKLCEFNRVGRNGCNSFISQPFLGN